MKITSYSVILQEYHSDIEHVRFASQCYDFCFENAKRLSSNPAVTAKYRVLLRKEVVKTSDIILNPITNYLK